MFLSHHFYWLITQNSSGDPRRSVLFMTRFTVQVCCLAGGRCQFSYSVNS